MCFITRRSFTFFRLIMSDLALLAMLHFFLFFLDKKGRQKENKTIIDHLNNFHIGHCSLHVSVISSEEGRTSQGFLVITQGPAYWMVQKCLVAFDR